VRVPFFLEPTYISKPQDFWETHETRMIRKFGSKAAFDRVKAAHGLVPRAMEVGLDSSVGFDQDRLDQRRQSSTRRAHRLVQFIAKKYSFKDSEKVYDELNRRHFTEGGILNDMALLLDSCKQVGLNRKECEQFLLSHEGVDEILQTVDLVHSYGIHSIPTLIVDGKYMIDGAAHADDVIKILRQIIRDYKQLGSLPGDNRRFAQSLGM
jgi:predicted DsbA family dithiol-disulfide isomerase